MTPGTEVWARHHYGPPATASNLSTVRAFGRNLAWHKDAKRALRRINRVFRKNCPEYHKHLKTQADVGTYNPRKIDGTSTWSNHAWPIAIDLDWNENARDGDHKSAMRDRGMKAINKLKKEGLIRWGGDYNSPDDMHLELRLTPKQIKAKYTWRGKLKLKRK